MYMFFICTTNPTTSSNIYRSFCYCRRFDTLFKKWNKLIKKKQCLSKRCGQAILCLEILEREGK